MISALHTPRVVVVNARTVHLTPAHTGTARRWEVHQDGARLGTITRTRVTQPSGAPVTWWTPTPGTTRHRTRGAALAQLLPQEATP